MKRYDLIDTIRGLAIISMILFHTCWLLNLFGMAVPTEMLFGTAFTVWERSICISFILVAGFCFSLSRNHVKAGLIVFGTGLAITVITCLFLPEIRIVFGVLTFIGSAIFLMIPLDKALGSICGRSKAAGWLVFAISLAAFLFTYNINLGYLGYGGFSLKPPAGLYKGYIATFVGFMEPGFRSTDYFSMIPWFFLYVCGYALYKLVKGTVAEERILTKGIPAVRTIGRYSLPVYVIHPVVIYLILYAIRTLAID